MQKLQNNQTSETIAQPITYKSFGDSITQGYYASTEANRYVNLIATNKGFNLTNVGLSGARMGDAAMIDNMYAEVVASSNVYTLLTGVNDQRVTGTSSAYLETYRGCLMAGVSWLAIPDTYKIKAANATRTGTWAVNTGIYGNMDYKSSTNNSTISAKVNGTTAYIGIIRDNASGGTFNVTIDGYVMGSYSVIGSVLARQTGDMGSYTAGLLRFPGLSYGEHTVTITVTSSTNASNVVYVDWFGGNGFQRDPLGPNVYVGNCMRASDAYYTSTPPSSDAGVTAYNKVINEAINSLSKDGLNVCLVDVVSAQDRNDLYDGLHPNDTGHAKIAQLFIEKMSSVVKNSDRGQAFITNTPWQLATLQNSWVVFSSGFYSPAFMKDAMGFVHLRGIAKSGTIGSNPIFTLPPGFRPGNNIHVMAASNVSGGSIGVVQVAPNGAVIAPNGNNAYVSFDNIIFMAEQ